MKFLNLLFVLCFTVSFSQTNYVEGVIITNDNEMIKGQINDKKWNVTPTKIEFKHGEDTFSYSADEILGFEIPGKKYISQNVNLDVTT